MSMHAMRPYGQSKCYMSMQEYAGMTTMDMLAKKYEKHKCDTAGCWYTNSDNIALVSESVVFYSDHRQGCTA